MMSKVRELKTLKLLKRKNVKVRFTSVMES